MNKCYDPLSWSGLERDRLAAICRFCDTPEDFETLKFEQFRLQPLDDDNQMANMKAAFEYCLKHPKWRLSLQTHKWLGVP